MEGPGGGFGEADLPGPQARVALVALVVERRPISHDALADIVWDGDPPVQWKSALAALVSKIRSLITGIGMDGSAIVVSAGGSYGFAAPPETWIDLEHAAAALDRAEGALRHGRLEDAVQEATVAASIFRRPLLAGAECSWLDAARERQRDARHRALVTLASGWQRLGDHQLASVVAETAVTTDPYRETGHRLLIEAHRDRGDSGAALRALQRCEQIFTEELGVHLSPETVALADQVRLPATR